MQRAQGWGSLKLWSPTDRSAKLGQPPSCAVAFQVNAADQKNQFVVVPAEGGAPVHRIEVSPESDLLRMARDGNGFSYVLHDGDVDNLWFQSFADGHARQLTHFASDHIYSYAFPRDGKHFALTRGSDRQDAVMLSNFR